MTLSVTNNASALSLLQSLNSTTQNLNTVNQEVSSGLAVSNASDNPAVFAVAQQQRFEISSLAGVSDGLNVAQSISDVAVSAGQTISDLLNQLKSTTLSATDSGQTTAGLSALNTQFQSLLQQIANTIANASFNGANLLDGSRTNGLQFLATADASSFVTLSTENLSLGGSKITVSAGTSLSSVTAATAALALVNASITNVNGAVATLGAQSNQIIAHASFITTLSDTLTTGVGGLVDADVAAESARLTALQVQQQLSIQALSIANQQPSVILTLLRSG